MLALCEAGETVFVYARHLHRDPLVPEPAHPRLRVRQVPIDEPAELATAAREDGIEHLHGSLMLSAQLAAFVAARELWIPFTITAYSGHSVFTARDPDLYRELSADLLCGGVVVEDPFMQEWVTGRLGADPRKVEIIPNSFDLEEYRLRSARQDRRPVRILSIARFVEKKGLAHLVEAFRRLRARGAAAEIRLIGSGPEEERLRALAGGDPAILFLGAQPEAKCREEYAGADVFCLPCVRAADGDADGIPTTVLEAMAFELPVVVSDLYSAPHYVRNGREGLLAQPGDAGSIADCLGTLCADPGLRRSLGRSGRLRVEELCDLRTNVERLRDLFLRSSRERPLVSIAITAYNRARFLESCIDSVLKQTYRPIDIVVVDDGSTDGTDALLARYDGQLRTFRHERNLGVAAAKNRALRMTAESARYVAILDSDDLFHPEFVERCVRHLESHPGEGLVYVNDVVKGEDGLELFRREDRDPWSRETWLRTRHLRGDGWMARRDLVLGTELHDERMPMDVDYDLFYQLVELTAFGHMAEALLCVRDHDGRSTRDSLALARCHAANLVKYGYSPEYAYLRARRNPEWIPAIEEGVALGRRLRAERERRRARKEGRVERPAIEGGKPVRENLLVFGAPSLGQEEIDEVVATLRSGWIGPGPRVARFEEEFADYVGARHAVALSSCTAGLFLNLLALGISPGDEVVTTPLTFAATANVIEHLGARPIFADVDPETLNLDPVAVERAVTPRTRAVLAVHFGGLPCDLDSLAAVAHHHGLALIEDAAHAIGARTAGHRIGGGDNPAVFSFYANKNLTTAEGGMVTTPDAALAQRLRLLRSHGLSAGPWERLSCRLPGPPELLAAGYKLNMCDLAAALGLPQLRRQEEMLRVRERYARRYDEAFRGLPLAPQWRPPEGDPSRHSLHLYVVRLEEGGWRVGRDRIVAALQAENVGATVHYPPLHLARYYREKYGFSEGLLPRAERAGRSILTLPLSPAMSEWDVDDVIEAVRKVAAAYANPFTAP